MQRSNAPVEFDVTADGDGLGVADALEAAAGEEGRRRRHRRGAVLRDVAVVLADGGDDFSAVEVLRSRPAEFGDAASDSTAWRAVAALAGDELAGVRLDAARKRVPAAAWGAGAEPPVIAAARAREQQTPRQP